MMITRYREQTLHFITDCGLCTDLGSQKIQEVPAVRVLLHVDQVFLRYFLSDVALVLDEPLELQVYHV